MNYHIEKLNEQTWLIEEYSNTASAYMYLLTGREKALLIDTGFGTIPLKSICEELTVLPVTVALTHAHSREDVRHIFTQDELFPVKENCSYFESEMVFEIGDRPVRVVRTPGHSVGSVCFLDEKNRWMFTGDTCCKAHVLLQMEFAAPMQTYKKSLEKLIAMESLYDITWPGHHIKPVEKQVIHDFLTAVEGITGGTMEGAWTELPMGKARLLEYKEIGIEY